MTNSKGNQQREAGQLDIDLSDKTVLIVDDEVFMLNLMNRVVKEFNAGAIERAANGQEAMTVLSRMGKQIDLIISDCNMAPINGLEFLKLVRGGATKDVANDLPFIMVTGHGDEPVVRKALELDVSGYCVKPVAPEKTRQGHQKGHGRRGFGQRPAGLPGYETRQTSGHCLWRGEAKNSLGALER